jgi:hypothetical protein
MRNVSSAFNRALANDKRDYLVTAKITLANGSVLNLTNEQIWSGGLTVEDAVSNDNVFQIGAAIVNKATLILNNIYEDFDAYDFSDAIVRPKVGLTGLDDGSTEYLDMGVYIVDDTAYNGSIITLTCLDYMSKLDKPYSEHIVYPATLGEIVNDICTRCGVTLASTSLQFPHYTYTVDEAPSGESTTHRQVLSWVAQIAGCFARFNSVGQLEIKWYDISAIETATDGLDGGTFNPWNTGDVADGGSFNPWTTGTEIDGGEFTNTIPCHYIASAYNSQISTDDVVITGVKVVKKVKVEGSSDAFEEYMNGTAGYVVSIEENDLIQGDHGQDIADWIGASLIGFAFRKATISHPNDPSIEAGDVALYWDRKGNSYSLIVSSTTFVVGGEQSTTSSAETPRKNSSTRFTESTRNYVEMRKQLADQKTTFEQVTEALAERIENSSGLYCTEVTEGGATKIYYHDKPQLDESNIVMLFSTAGFTVTANYQAARPTWYGMTVDGNFVASIMNTIGLNFDWGTGGTLTLGGKDNTNGTLRVLDASGNQIGSWTKDGVTIKNGQINMNDGNIWDKNGLTIKNGQINMNDGRFAVDKNGNATAMSLTAYGSLICYESYTIS